MGWMDGWIDWIRMDGWIGSGWMDWIRMDGCMGGLTDGCMGVYCERNKPTKT